MIPMLPGIKQFDLTGRVALITGGSKGLGYAMAAGLASAGADVLLVSRKGDEAKAAAAVIARWPSPPTSPRRTRSTPWSPRP
jgi:NAD(P)-dependent dehydrogenase (short-subunit alcohol dehydrogenase family)